VAALGRRHQRRGVVPVVVELVHIGVVGKKEADELGGALLRGQVQRGLAPPGLGLEVSLELDEPLGRLDVAAVPIRGPKA
jgi:hypothetical protein